jgi:quinoprotein relay system zinc metallohydrolase 1
MKRTALLHGAAWALLALLLCTPLRAGDFDYGLRPRRIAPDTYVLVGRNEDFDTRNGGNIVNTGFIVTAAGVVVIDSGPSQRYGEQMRQAIARITDRPILRVFITHQHPDHFLGNQAFPPASLNALPGTIAAISRDGNALAENMYRLAGDWMRGTEATAPTQAAGDGDWTVAEHRLHTLALAGHTGADLAIFDESTGVLFCGDLVFHGRAPTTPNAQLGRWFDSLDRLEQLSRSPAFRHLVPGHGEVADDAGPIRETRDYLSWLQTTMRRSAEAGLDMNEVMATPLPPTVSRLAVVAAEFRRSVGHLFPAAEQEALAHGHRH